MGEDARITVGWAALLVSVVAIGGVTGVGAIQQETVAAAGTDLSTLFDVGHLVIDTNGDSVPDFVNARLVLGNPATNAELRAASEIAARLGFETMAMDLPVARGSDGAGIPIVIGAGGLAAAGLVGIDMLPEGLPDGEGVVSIWDADGVIRVLVLGVDDAGLMAAARRFAGALPHTRTLSSPHLNDVRHEVLEAIDAQSGELLRFMEARVRADKNGIVRVVAELRVADDRVRAAAEAARGLVERSRNDDSTRLAYRGLDTLELRVIGATSTAPAILVNVAAAPEPAGPIPGRPGSGAKRSMDLSNLYTVQGLLGDSDENLIPDRVDAVLVAGELSVTRLPDLAGRLGLESAGLVVPVTRAASEVERPGREPTMVLAGTNNVLIDSLVERGLVDTVGLNPGEGMVQLVPKAFGEKSALVVSGADSAGASRALQQLAETFPHIQHRGKDRPTLDDVEYELWSTLSGRTPAGQAAIGLYKLDRIATQLSGRELDSVDVLVSVEKPDESLLALVRERAEAIGADRLTVSIDDRDVQNASRLFDQEFVVPSEVERFWSVFRNRVLPAVSTASPGATFTMEVRLSEPLDVRRRIADQAREALIGAGLDPQGMGVQVLSAFKQGFSWLDEAIRPRLEGMDVGEIAIRFRRNDPPAEWPQQAMNTPVRWLHEIFPIDEVLARDLDIDLDRIRFEMIDEGPTYEVLVTDSSGRPLLRDSFEPRWVLRPYFDRFQDYEKVRVTTGWIDADLNGSSVVSERIVTDPEWFWDYFQAKTLPAVYDYVMERHEGNPRGGGADAPFFGELVVELELSEPNYLLGVDKEIIAPMDAVHEEIYFGTLEFFHLIGRNARGQDLTYPGRVIPIMRPKGDGRPGKGRITFSGFATSRPAVVVSYRERSGKMGELRLDIPKITMERPSARVARVRHGVEGLTRLDLRVRVDAERDERDRWLVMASPTRVDQRMISAEQVVATMQNLEAMRESGMYESALAFPGLGEIVVNAEWTHEDDPESRRSVTLPANGTPAPLPDWSTLVPRGWEYRGDRLVQWDTPMPPPEGHRVLGQMAQAFEEASVYQVGESYLGKPIWAMDLMPPVRASHWSHAKATTFKPTVIYSARQHANEVSSTSHVLRHAELLLTDPEQRKRLNKVNVVIHPFTNPDGAQLAYDLFEITPELILHAGYLASLGMDPTSGSGDDFPIYPETNVRLHLWQRWLPDIFLNPHGYPSHQVVQLFSEYTGLVRRGRVTERNWGFNKGWFMPGFGYVDDPKYPRHKDAAFSLRDYITRAINGNSDVFDMNQRNYARYRRYGATFDRDVFRLPMVDSVLIEMPLKGSRGQGKGMNNPKVTIWSGTTEAPDETAYGEWMQLVAKAGLSWDQAILDYLYEGDHKVDRSGSTFFGGVTLKLDRPRPPKSKEDDDDAETSERGNSEQGPDE